MKSFLKVTAAALALTTVMAGSARADEVSFAGYTNGCFNCVSPPNTSATQTATLNGLTYVNSQFSNTTVGGFLAIGGNPLAPPTQNVNNLGAISLSTSPFTYTGNTFTLRTTFTLPTGINGGNTTLFSATLTGAVNVAGNGGVRFDFDNTPLLYTFSDGATSGSFMFSVNDVSIDPGQTAGITGQIESAQQATNTVPEPGSVVLMATGLAGLGFATRRKRNKA
jgi:hypothetical protein